ncbi:MAG TPA: tRNA (adenosine(37)-N6)-threonylcarbamoyltransferase complex ATPase subunit type 1 TsaE [Magnetospirillaceae bacterium]|nr:tRNA (adenosine(37)-N6)-threonylcarbamoyltransferase complex ATPase subunit type 1 TsaE [Magnetospirillaceae bacterium]
MPKDNPQFQFTCKTVLDTQNLAAAIGRIIKGGDVIEFTSDLGGGKTAFVKGLALGMGVTDVVQSPTFMLSILHKADRGLELHHFDFYRLHEAGIMSAELAESLQQINAVTAVEWGDIVHDVLPPYRMSVNITVPTEETRVISFSNAPQHIAKALYDYQQNKHIA